MEIETNFIEEMELEVSRHSLENISSLRGADDDIEEEEDDEEEPVTLGFVEKPKNLNSLLSHFFPSKAGGAPVCL